MSIPLIKLSHVSKYYKTKTGVSEGMRDINLEFFNNEFVAITGESGSGKTTLLNVISGLDSYEDGELFYQGNETSHFSVKDFEKFRARNIGFVFQNYNVIDSYTVYDNVEIALVAQNYPKDKIKSRALELIEKVGLLSHKDQRTSKLSGGQKQRVVIARALAKDSPIILADEPTGNLDEASSNEVLTLLKDISKDRLVIMVSHNMAEVDKFATRKVIMKDGSVTNDIEIEKKEITDATLNDDLKNSNSVKKGFKIAFKNIIRTPKRSIFTLLLSSIVLFSFMYFYSTLIVNVVSSITGSFSNDYKIAVIKRDGNDYTNEEFNSFKYNKNVAKYFEIEFNLLENLPEDFNGNEFEKEKYRYGGHLESSIRDEDIYIGKRPSNTKEVMVREYGRYDKFHEINSYVKFHGIDFKVVGKVEVDYYTYSIYDEIYFYDDFIYDSNFNINNEAKDFVKDDVKFNKIVFSADDRREIKLYKKTIDDIKYQIIDTDLIMEKEMEFIVGTVKLLLWIVLLVILQVIFLVIYQIQKNVMESRKKDFSVYRSIGISEQEVSVMILFEQLLISLIAAIIIVSLFTGLSGKVTFIYKITRNITLLNYILIVLIFAIFSLRLGQKFNKKIFGLTVIEALKEDN